MIDIGTELDTILSNAKALVRDEKADYLLC